MIAAKNISVTVNGNRKLLNDVSIDIEPGLFTAIAGPNGAGKTSLLNVLSSESTRHTGVVEINGVSADKYSVGDLSMVRAVLPQSTHMQFQFSVQQIVELGRQHHKGGHEKSKQVIAEVMELTGVHEWSNRNYLTLSGGEQQRVQLARVLAQVWETKSYPRYILLDEPTASLDLAQQQLIFALVKHACEKNIGVMAIVHDLNQVAQFADKLYFIREGSIVTAGNTREVFTKQNIETTFCCRVNVYHDPCTDCPYIVPDKNVFLSPLKKVTV
jgi:iron complex transport system ATP-binding protein